MTVFSGSQTGGESPWHWSWGTGRQDGQRGT